MGVALWSLATLVTRWYVSHSITMFLAVCTFFGLAQGVAIPSMSYLLSRWFPSHQRSSAAVFYPGNVAGLLMTPIIMSSAGIFGPFIFYSSLGLQVILLAWQSCN